MDIGKVSCRINWEIFTRMAPTAEPRGGSVTPCASNRRTSWLSLTESPRTTLPEACPPVLGQCLNGAVAHGVGPVPSGQSILRVHSQSPSAGDAGADSCTRLWWLTFNPEQAVDFASCDQDHHQTVNKDHRRIQPRRCQAIGNAGHWTCLPRLPRGREPSPRRRCGAEHADPATNGPLPAVQGATAKEYCAAKRTRTSRNDGYCPRMPSN